MLIYQIRPKTASKSLSQQFLNTHDLFSKYNLCRWWAIWTKLSCWCFYSTMCTTLTYKICVATHVPAVEFNRIGYTIVRESPHEHLTAECSIDLAHVDKCRKLLRKHLHYSLCWTSITQGHEQVVVLRWYEANIVHAYLTITARLFCSNISHHHMSCYKGVPVVKTNQPKS